jgi:hypothetical protein
MRKYRRRRRKRMVMLSVSLFSLLVQPVVPQSMSSWCLPLWFPFPFRDANDEFNRPIGCTITKSNETEILLLIVQQKSLLLVLYLS